ncbi:MAG: MogA/MoaB family molybdenum cofactor biosynthesis protein [Thermodesulfobacteriota bacterium]|nr:MogA/MoaB family molybdenum cofactor biosynthesis protein [Thermodesulfobacteriota bacterium]
MDRQIKAAVLTISDKGARGLRKDESGEAIVKILEDHGFLYVRKKIVPDDPGQIADTIREWVDKDRLPLVVTSGGTGLSPTDVTPQAMKEVIDYEVPGMAEAMRADGLKKTPHAMISRAMVGVRHSCLIINLPGSLGGARDNLLVVLPALDHALAKLAGDPSDCGT